MEFLCYANRSATLQLMGTISVGYGEGDAVDDAETFDIDGRRYSVKVADHTGALQIDMPGRVRIYAAGFWKYVDVDEMSVPADTAVNVTDE